MEASEFGHWNPGPEPEPSFSEKLDDILFPSSPEKQLRNNAIFAGVSLLILALVLAK